jgi:hypothetical protein
MNRFNSSLSDTQPTLETQKLLDLYVSDTRVTPDTLVTLETVKLFDLNVSGTSETVVDTPETVCHLDTDLFEPLNTPNLLFSNVPPLPLSLAPSQIPQL